MNFEQQLRINLYLKTLGVIHRSRNPFCKTRSNETQKIPLDIMYPNLEHRYKKKGQKIIAISKRSIMLKK